MTDRIFIRGLVVPGNHGVLAEENALGQKFIFDITCETDFSDCLPGDEVGKTTNYAEICDLVVAVSDERTVRLLETLADRVARAILKRFSRVSAVTVAIGKPGAPIAHTFDTVGIEITRTRNG